MISFPQRCALLLMLLVVPTIGHGQIDGSTDFKTVVSVTPAGVRRYEPGAWSTLSVTGTNRSKADTTEFVTVFIGENARVQFARRFWLPAGTRRQTYVPILIPKVSPTNPRQFQEAASQITASIIRINESDGVETFAENALDTHITDQPLLLD